MLDVGRMWLLESLDFWLKSVAEDYTEEVLFQPVADGIEVMV